MKPKGWYHSREQVSWVAGADQRTEPFALSGSMQSQGNLLE